MRVQQLFAEVVGLDDERRSARLERIEDSGIRREVQTLLDRHARGEPLSENALSPREPEAEEHEVVGRYRLLDELGRGAMGVVYRAEDTRLGRPVALKFLSPELSADERARARLEREARAASALDHPNICTVYEIGETDDGQLYLALACYDGETLERRIERGPLEVEEAVRTAVHVARGLAAAHRHGIVHRDVKPSNVLVTDDRDVKLLDFGIARVADSDLTGSGDVLGTVAYMSPEQLRGEVDARVDVWALGVVLYEMLTGRRPFRGDYEAALLYAVLHEDPAPLDRDDVPEELAEIVRRCLEKAPDDRYQSAEEVEVSLERLGLGSASVPPVRSVFQRKLSLALGASAAVLALAFLFTPLGEVGAGWFGLNRGPDVRHLAVLPLMTPPEEAAVGEGLTLTLTSLLTQLGAQAEQSITVVPASEMREVTTAAEAHERFDVDVAVSGDFRREGDNHHLMLNLIDARTLRQVDSEALSEPDGRFPHLQRHALAALVAMLDLSLSVENEAMLDEGSTINAEAYEWYLRGEAALDRFDQPENVDKALELFRWALDEDSLYALAHAGFGEAAMRKYEYSRDAAWVERAKASSHRALGLASRLAEVRVTLGHLENLTGDHEAAVREFGLALEIDSMNAEGYFGLASALASLGRTEQAEANYRRTIELQPSDWQYHSAYGVFLLDEGRYRESLRQFERVVALSPDNTIGYTNLASAYLYLEEWDHAEAALEQSNAVMPTWQAYSNLGYIYYSNGLFNEEVRTYERALSMDSSDHRIWGNLAAAYLRSGKREALVRETYARAAALTKRHLAVNPNDAVAIVALADYQLSAGHEQEAEVTVDQVATTDGLSVGLMADIGTLYERLGQREEAVKWIARAVENGYPMEHLENDDNLKHLLRDFESNLVN